MAEKLARRSQLVTECGCRIWTGAVQIRTQGDEGYGIINIPCGRGKREYAHRAAWELEHGPIQEGVEICHKCDVRLCINTEHMFLGTRKDNLHDAAMKGRMLKKLTLPRVEEILGMHRAGLNMSEIARRMKVSHPTIKNVLRGRGSVALGMSWNGLR